MLPVVDLTWQRENAKKKKSRFRPKAKPAAKVKQQLKKQGAPAPVIVMKKWPIFAPRDMLDALAAANALQLVFLALRCNACLQFESSSN